MAGFRPNPHGRAQHVRDRRSDHSNSVERGSHDPGQRCAQHPDRHPTRRGRLHAVHHRHHHSRLLHGPDARIVGLLAAHHAGRPHPRLRRVCLRLLDRDARARAHGRHIHLGRVALCGGFLPRRHLHVRGELAQRQGDQRNARQDPVAIHDRALRLDGCRATADQPGRAAAAAPVHRHRHVAVDVPGTGSRSRAAAHRRCRR